MNIFYLVLLSLPFSLLAFLFESYPRLKNRFFGVDIWTHLLYLKEYHRQGGIPKKIENGFLVPGEYDYPPAFIFILSKFPLKWVEKYEFLFSPFFDVIHLLFIFWISYFLTNNIAIAILTQILYTLTPIIILENCSATPRSLGYTLFTVLMFSFFYYELSGNNLFLISALIVGSLIFLSHRFTTQGFLFFAIFFSVFEKNPIYVVVFACSFVLAVIFSRGFYLKVLRGHIGNLTFWFKNINYRFAHQVKGNFKDYKTDDFVFRLYNQFLKLPPIVITVTNPWTLPVLYIFIFSFPADFLLGKLIWWVIFSYILVLLTTWVPFLKFLGEPQRYLELSVFPAAFLSALFLANSIKTDYYSYLIIFYLIVSVAAFITIIVIQRKAIIKDKLRTVTPKMEEMFVYLKSLKVKPKLLCIPHQITTNTIYHTGCSVFVNADYTNIDKISDVYPFLRIPIEKIMKKYNLDAVLLNEDYATIADLKLEKFMIIKQTGNFVLLSSSFS